MLLLLLQPVASHWLKAATWLTQRYVPHTHSTLICAQLDYTTGAHLFGDTPEEIKAFTNTFENQLQHARDQRLSGRLTRP